MKTLNPILLMILLASCTRSSQLGQTTANAVYLPAIRGDIDDSVSWRGIVRAANRIEIRADKKLKVKRTLVAGFAPVKKGQPLVEVDNSEVVTKHAELKEKYRAFLLEKESAILKYEHSQKVVKRKKTLLQKGIVAAKEFEEASRESKVSETELRAKQLEDSKLKKEIMEVDDQLNASVYSAPMDGIASSLITAEQGSEVQAGQLLAVVADTRSLALWISVEETLIHKIAVGTRAAVKLDAFPGESLKGKIIDVGTSSSAGGASRIKTYSVGVSLEASDKKIQEGYAGEVAISFGRREGVVSVPLSALRYSDGKNYLEVASSQGGTSVPREVQLGLRTMAEAEVLSGLRDGEFVIVETSRN